MPTDCAPRRCRTSIAGTSSAARCARRSSTPPSTRAHVPLDAFGLALAAAVLHAGWNVLLRGARDVQAATAATLGLGLVLFAPVAVATWHVHAAAWPYIAASSALETAYFFLLVGAYRLRELSVVYPVARGSAPVLVLLGSAVVLGRSVSAGEAAGVCLVAAGVLLVRGLAHGASGIAAGLAIGVTIAAYTLVDKDGVKHASPLPYLELVLVLPAVASVAYVVARRAAAHAAACPDRRIGDRVVRGVPARARGAAARSRARGVGGARDGRRLRGRARRRLPAGARHASAPCWRRRRRRRRRAACLVLALERKLGVARPLVPRAGVVARVVAGAPQRERCQRRAGAGVAVRDHLGALGQSDEIADPLRRLGDAWAGEELSDLDMLRAGDVPLPRVARAAATSRELIVAAHVDDGQRRVVEPRRQLAARRQRARARLEVGLAHGRELVRPGLDLAGPRRHAADQDGDARMSRQLGELRRRHGADAVAAVNEDETLPSGDAVPAKTQHDLLRELRDGRVVRRRRRRAEHERPRSRNVAARVRVRAPHVADDEIAVTEMRGQPLRVDHGRKLRDGRRHAPPRRRRDGRAAA